MDILVSVICSVVASVAIVTLLNCISDMQEDKKKDDMRQFLHDGFGIIENRIAALDNQIQQDMVDNQTEILDRIDECLAIKRKSGRPRKNEDTKT